MAAKINRLISSCSTVVFSKKSFHRTRLQIHRPLPEPKSLNRNSLYWLPLLRTRMASTDSTTSSALDSSNETLQLETSNGATQNEVILESTLAATATGNNKSEAENSTDEMANSSNVTEELKPEEKKHTRVPKIKAAVLLSYSGQGYFGMQIQNSGARTIENDLLQAFFDAKVIDEEGFQKPKSIKFQRAARTDKNVSAARNIISVMLPKTFDPDSVNKFLPNQIRVMDFKRVTKGFDAKIACNARTYLYMIPTFAFVPFEEKVREDYRITPEVMENLRRVLKLYEGTKNYHNFTSRKKPTDPSAYRYIMSFDSSDPFVQDGLEFVVLKVKGQSFMLHQIRKMIGLAVAILRGYTNEDTLTRAFKLDKIDIPMAPGLGLMLGETHYDHYNKKFGNDGIHEPLKWDNVAEKIEKFCQEMIYCNVTKTENEEKSLFQWLATVPFHTFDSRDIDDPKGFGPLGKAHLRVKRERGEDVDDVDDEEEESEDDEMPQKKQRSN